jgi:hypothetical protein
MFSMTLKVNRRLELQKHRSAQAAAARLRLQIMKTFANVLGRVADRTVKENSTHVDITTASGDLFRLNCAIKGNVAVTCHVMAIGKDNGAPRLYPRKIFYKFRCPKDKLPKIRKQALILSKKISLYGVYRVMET